MDDDFQEVSDFVQEDSDNGTDEQEELLQAKIQREHAKFKEQQQRWQAQVRAARPWSAPPLSSPRPESQRFKKHEASELARAPVSMLLASNPREEYVPPPRAQLLGPGGQGDNRPASADMAHLGPPRPASADTPRSGNRLLGQNSGLVPIKHSGLADIQEESPLVTHPDIHNGHGGGSYAARAESQHSNEEPSSRRTSFSASPIQQHAASVGTPPQPSQPTPSTARACSPSCSDQEASIRPTIPATLGREASVISSADGSEGDDGDEDLFCLCDQETQALQDNLEAYNSRAQNMQQEPCALKLDGEAPSTPVTSASQATTTIPPVEQAHRATLEVPAQAAIPGAHSPPQGGHELEHSMAHGSQQDELRQGSPAGVVQSDSAGGEEEPSNNRSSSSSSNAGEGSGGDDERSKEGGLLPPHKFALHLMAHDLRTLPAHLGSPPHHSSSTRQSGVATYPPAHQALQPPSPRTAAATAAAAHLPFCSLPSRADLGGRPYLGSHHTTYPHPLSPNYIHVRYPNSNRSGNQHVQGSSQLASKGVYDRPWGQWGPERLRQHLGLSTRPMSAAAADRVRPCRGAQAVKSTRSFSAIAAGSQRFTHAPSYSDPGWDQGTDARWRSASGARHAQEREGGRQEQGGAGADATEGMTGSDVQQEMPTLRNMAGAEDEPASAQPVTAASGKRGSSGGGAYKFEEWFERMMGIATEEGEGPTLEPEQEGVPKQEGANQSSSFPRAEYAPPHSPEPSSPSTHHNRDGTGRQHRRGKERMSRPNTAPSTRQNSRQVSPYSSQVLNKPHARSGPVSPYHDNTSYGPASWEATHQRPLLSRPASAHARLKGANSPAMCQPLYKESSVVWASAMPTFTPAPAPPMPQKVDATAAVNVGKATVSVYIEDATRRVMEANRWMAYLELRRRYRLRSRLSNMVVQVYDSTWQPQLDDFEEGQAAAVTAPTNKELTIKQFLALHLRLKAQVVQAGVINPSGTSAMVVAGGLKGSHVFAPQAAAAAASYSSKPQRPRSAVVNGGARTHAGQPRQRPTSAGVVGAGRPKHCVMKASQMRDTYTILSPHKQEKKQPSSGLYVSVPHTLQQPRSYFRKDEEGLLMGRGISKEAEGSTAHVRAQLDAYANQCQALSQNISLLGGVVC